MATEISNDPPSNESNIISNEVLNAFNQNPCHEKGWSKNSELLKRQNAVLSELPSSAEMAKIIVQEIVDSRSDESIHAELRNHKPIFSSPKELTRSILFEQLVEIEVSKKTEGDKFKKLRSAITKFFKHPPTRQLILERKPDIVDVDIVETNEPEVNKLVLKSTYEVKTGTHLYHRAYLQLKESYLFAYQKFVKSINNLDSRVADHLNLSEIGEGRKKLIIDPDLTQNIVLCRDVNTNDLDQFINRSEFSETEYNEFKQMIRGNHEKIKVKIIKSCITERELDFLHKLIWPEVNKILREKYKT